MASNPIFAPLLAEVDPNPGNVRTATPAPVIPTVKSQGGINQLRGNAQNATTGQGIPKQVTNVSVSVANGAKGSTAAVSVLYQRDPTDKNFSGVTVFVKGYQGNNNAVQVAAGSNSPLTFTLNNTGENVSFVVQSYGNSGNAPIASAPTASTTLPKSAVAGYGVTTTTAYTPASPPPSTASFSLSTAGQGWLDAIALSPFVPSTMQAVVPSIAAGAGSANQVGCVQFVLPYSITISAIAEFVVSGGGSGYSCAAIYNAAGTTKLVDAGTNAFDTHSASQVTRKVSISPVTLSPGVYWLAVGSTDVAGSVVGYNMYQYLPGVVNANSIVRYGTAANAISSGVMPSSLGTITGFGTTNSSNVPLVLFLV